MDATFFIEEIGPRPPRVPRGHWWCQAEPIGRSGMDITLALPIAGTRGNEYVTSYCHTPDGWIYPCAQAVVDQQEDATRWAFTDGAWQESPGGLWVPPADQLAELYPIVETGLWAEILGTVGTIGGAFVGGAGAPVGGAAGAALGAGIDGATASPTAPPGSRYRYAYVEGPLGPGAVRYRQITDVPTRRMLFNLATEIARSDLTRGGDLMASPWDPARQPSLADLERRRSEILRTFAYFADDTAGGGSAATAQQAATAAALLAAAAAAIAGAARSSSGGAASATGTAPAGSASSALSGIGSAIAGGASSRAATAAAGAATAAAGAGTAAAGAGGGGTAAQLLAMLGALARGAGTTGTGAAASGSSAPVSPQTAATLLGALQGLAGGSNASTATTAAGGNAGGADALAGLLRGVLGAGAR